MKCKKCGKSYNANFVICPFCGYQEEDISSLPSSTSTLEEDNNSSSSLILIFVFIIIIASIAYIVYNNMIKKNEEETLLFNHDITLDYKSNGYSFIDLDLKEELDGFDLINNNYSYIDNKSVVDLKSFCNLYNINITNDNGVIVLSSGDYSKKVSSINNARFFTAYNKDVCECNDFNIVILTNDGKVYIYESDTIEFNNENELIDNIILNFEEIHTEGLIRSISVTSFVGEINPCGEKVLLMLDENNEKFIYRNNNVLKTKAPYSHIIYNVVTHNDINYSIFINNDRTLLLASEYNSNLPLLKDESNNTIKYVGSFKDKNSNIMYILSIDGVLYKLDFNKDINSILLERTNYGIVNNIGYKFDPHNNVMTYVFLFNGGSKNEFTGDFETHGVFSVR